MVGMKNPKNVKLNLTLGEKSPLSPDNFWRFLKPEGKEESSIGINLW